MPFLQDGAVWSRAQHGERSAAVRGLLAGVSLFALAVSASSARAAERPFSPGWFQQRAQARATAAATPGASGLQQLTATQRGQVDRSLANMTQATAALRRQLAGQATARAAAALRGNPAGVADGLRPGGLVPYPGATSDAAVRSQGLVWDGANLPTEQRNGDDVTVSVQQTTNKAILTWQSFNVGINTTLDFVQRSADGTPQRDWVALNRVVAGPPDANGRRQVASPSQILGRINADGEVYIINQNGILFGGASLVNVRSLVASTLDVGRSNMRLTERNAYFRNPDAGQMSFSFQYLYKERADGIDEGIEARTLENVLVVENFDGQIGAGAQSAAAVLAADEVEGSIDVEAGALIQTRGVGSDGALGRIALIAPQVVNRGHIDTPDGQTLLVGARNATMYSNDSSALDGTGLSPDSRLRGAVIAAGVLDTASVRPPVIPGSTVANGVITPPLVHTAQGDAYKTSLHLENSAPVYAGSVVNTGVVTAERGNITLTGAQLTQAGVLAATTSVNANGSIFLHAFDTPYVSISDTPVAANGRRIYDARRQAKPGLVQLTDGSVISILADTQLQADGSVQTIPTGSTQSFDASAIEISIVNGYSNVLRNFTNRPGTTIPFFNPLNFPDPVDSTVAGRIDIGSGSLVKAPGANLRIAATTQAISEITRQDPSGSSASANIVIREGAAIDVSGLMAVPVRMEDNLVTIPIVTANDLADSPLQRNGILRNRSGLIVDRRATGLRSDGTRWYGTPVFDANGYINAQGLPVEQLLVGGGTVTIEGATVAQSGSLISVAGGYKQYAGGYIQTSALLADDGQHVSAIGRADPYRLYRGIAGQFTERHDRWGQTTTYDGLNLVAARRHYEPGYLEGGNAGSLTIDGPLILEGRVDGGAIQGPYQRAGGPYASVATRGATLDFTGTPVNTLLFRPTQALKLAAGSLSTDPLPLIAFLEQTWGADWIEASGAADLRFGNATDWSTGSAVGYATQSVEIGDDTDLQLPPGGRISFTGRDIDVAGRIRAPAGAITFTLSRYEKSLDINSLQRSTFVLRPGAVLDVAGLWVNDRGASIATFVGADYVNGGAVTIQTDSLPTASRSEVNRPIPNLSSITFTAGSSVDLASGGYVTSSGQLRRDGDGVAIGRGGDLSILFHPGADRPNIVPLDPSTAALPAAEKFERIDDELVLAGTITAFGFQGGGTFRLRAPVLSISDGGAAGGTGGEFNLPASFFEQGFGSYDLTALLRARIEPGTQIHLRQPQWQPAAQATFAVSRADATTPGFNLGRQRVPVNLSLTSLAFVDYNNTWRAALDADPFLFAYAKRGVAFTSSNALIVGAGSLIEGDPKASISLSSQGQLTFAGTIRAPGGTVALAQRRGVANTTNAFDTSLYPDFNLGGTSLFLLPTAVIDVRGTTVVDPRQPFRSGTVLPGGQVSLTATNLIGQPGSRIDASGAAGVLDLTAPRKAGSPLRPTLGSAPTTIVSDAGSIGLSISVADASWDFDPLVIVGYNAARNPAGTTTLGGNSDGVALVETTLTALPGGPGARGGTLTLSGPAILFRNEGVRTASGDNLAAVLQPDTLIPPKATLPVAIPAGMLIFGTDRLAGSGIDSLVVAGRGTNGEKDGVVGFEGDVTVSVGRRISFNDVGVLTSVPVGSFNLAGRDAPTTGVAGNAVIQAQYIAIHGKQSVATYGDSGFTAPWLPGTLTVRGDVIDVGGSVLVQNTGRLSLESRRDLRFVPVFAPINAAGARELSLTTVLRSAGDIVLRSAQAYPTTAVRAVVQSTLGDGTITILGNGNQEPLPLSAGGSLYLSAAEIIQRGVVRAPLGGLFFGVRDESIFVDVGVPGVAAVGGVGFQPTERVEFAAGSVTSTSAAGLTIPYGQTANLRDWTYATVDSVAPLSAPPEKSITVDAPVQTLAAGATLDMGGGGDIYAYEWVAGLGGSRNVLTTSTNGAPAAEVYAIIPAYGGALAPVDPVGYGRITAAGDTAFNDIGRTLTIGEGVPGLPAGTYLLLPGAYATLPGAYRVQVVSNSQDSLLDAPVALADGTQIMAGRLGDAFGSRDSRSQTFSIQSGAVWRQYSEIIQTSGTQFFANLAAKREMAPPRLPIDAGRLTLVLRGTERDDELRLALGADLNFATASGGRGGQVDIAAPEILVVSGGAAAVGGGIVLTPEDIRSFNAESVLLGATRTSTADGDSLSVMAETIRVATTDADPLSNPELVLAAHDEIKIEAGSVVAARGSASGVAASDILVSGGERFRDGSNTVIDATGGDGTLVRVSAGNVVQVRRAALKDGSNAAAIDRITIGAGSVIDGGGALQIDSSKDTLIDTAALLGGQNIDLAGSEIHFLGGGNAFGPAALQLLSSARTLSIRAGQSITFAQPMQIRAATGAARIERLTLDTPRLIGGALGGGAVDVDATTVVLGNTFASDGSALNAVAGDGVFRATADTLVLTGNDRILSGFDHFEGTSTQQTIVGQNKEAGVLTMPGDVSLVTPLVTLGGGSRQTLSATGSIAILGAGSAVTAGEAGGRLTLDAASVTLDTAVSARAGIVDIRARSGDVVLGSGATLFAGGFTQEFLDTRVILAGGRITLQADTGDVVLQPGAHVDVAAGPGGNGGALNVVIGDSGGQFAVGEGTLALIVDDPLRGGARFSLDSRGAVDLGRLVGELAAGRYSGGVRVRSGLGDLVLTQNVTASDVGLVADGGRVSVGAVIDASGPSGGRIDLFGAGGVSLAAGAQLLARATTEAGRGGQVTIGTIGTGLVDLAGGSLIDVAGGSDYGSGGGIVHLRVPFLDAAEQTIGAHAFGAAIANATAVILEPYQRLDLGADAFNNATINAADVWNTIFAAFTPKTEFGATTQDLQQALGDQFFVMPGLELYNGNPAVNNGDIRITSSLDLVDRRYDGSPGILTIRAVGDLRIDASINDGFRADVVANNTTAAANLLSCANTATCLTSWSYNLVAGARTGSADPLALEQAAVFESGALADRGNFVFGAIPSMAATNPLGKNDIIRTGTGWINVLAGGHGLGSRAAVVVNLSANAIAAGFRRDADAAILFTSPTAVVYTAGVQVESEDGFDTAVDDLASQNYAAAGISVKPTQIGLVANRPAFATRGGDLRFQAPNGSIIGQQNYTDALDKGAGVLTGQTRVNGINLASLVYAGQLFTPWLLSQGIGSANRSEVGVFGGSGVQSARWVLTGAFQQGIAALGGGDVSVEAGGNVDNISASVVSTYRAVGGRSVDDSPRLVTYGGGNLLVDAGGRLGSIVTLVDEGSGTIRSGDTIGATYRQNYVPPDDPSTVLSAPVGPMFFIGDASLAVEARGSIEIGAVGQPEFQRPFVLDIPVNSSASPSFAREDLSLAYSESSALRLTSAAGDILFQGTNLEFLAGYGGQEVNPAVSDVEPFVEGPDSPGGGAYNSYLPPTVRLAAPQGDVTIKDGLFLAPSPTGNLDVLAKGSIYYFRLINGGNSSIKLFDLGPRTVASPLNPVFRSDPAIPATAIERDLDPARPVDWRQFGANAGYALDAEASAGSSGIFNSYYVHANPVLHRDDRQPVRIIALEGDIINGRNPADLADDPLSVSPKYSTQGLYLNKAASIYAGRDIVNLTYTGFNASVDHATAIVAGRDITYDLGLSDTVVSARGSDFVVGGPGQFLLQAGRDLLLKPSDPAVIAASGVEIVPAIPNGIRAVGNRINPHQPSESAEISILFGVGPGIDQQAFISRYIDPSNAGSVAKNYLPELVVYMQDRLTREARERDPLSGVGISLTEEEAFALFSQLSSAQQLAFVQQVLFAEIRVVADQLGNPDQFQNYPRAYEAVDTLFPARLGYTDNLSSSPVRIATGDLDMLDAVVRTEFGSGINILGPGGRATLGGLNSLSTLPANVQGVFTLRGGGINAYLDGNFDVFNSRVLTLQGGDITVMSGNGNVDAGRGRNTERVFPPLVTRCNPQTTGCAIDFGGLVSGAGIGTIAAVPGVPPGDVFLLAPRGVIDAGAAGIRSTGNLFTLALTVLNAENVQVGGQAVGLSQTSGPPVAALTAASGVADKAAAASDVIAASRTAGQGERRRLPTIYTTELVGFGGWDGPE